MDDVLEAVAVSEKPANGGVGDSESRTTLRLEDRLIASGLLTKEGLERANRTLGESGERLEVILVRLGLMTEIAVSTVLAAHYNLPLFEPSDLPSEALYRYTINVAYLKQSQLLPLKENQDELVIAMADPSNDDAVQSLRQFVGKAVTKRVATPKEIETALAQLYGEPSATFDDEALATGVFDENRTDAK